MVCHERKRVESYKKKMTSFKTTIFFFLFFSFGCFARDLIKLAFESVKSTRYCYYLCI